MSLRLVRNPTALKLRQYPSDYGSDGDGTSISAANQVVAGSNCGWMWKTVDDDWDIRNEAYWTQLLDNGLAVFCLVSASVQILK